MPVKWQIFKAANIVELVLTTSLFFYSYNANVFHSYGTLDYQSLTMQFLMALIVTINCSNNIFLINLLNKDKKIGIGRKIFFWIFFTLFLIVALFFGSAMAAKDFAQLDNRHLWLSIASLFICFIGIYIIILQLRLFETIKKVYKKYTISLVKEVEQSFYRSVCIIDIAGISVFILVITYTIFIKQKTITTSDILGLFACCLALSISFVTDIQGIRLINKFSLRQNTGRVFNNTLIIFYVLLCLLFIFITCLDYVIIKNFFRWRNYHDRNTILFLLEFLLLSLTTLYKIIFTWKLAKSVRSNYNNFFAEIETIGTIE